MSEQTSTLPQRKKPIGKSVIIGVSAIVIIALAIIAFVLIPILNRPNPEIIAQTQRQEGYQFYVDVGVRNNGAGGWVKVYAQIESDIQFDVKETRLYLGNAEVKSLTFTFTLKFEQGSGGAMIASKVWATPD